MNGRTISVVRLVVLTTLAGLRRPPWTICHAFSSPVLCRAPTNRPTTRNKRDDLRQRVKRGIASSLAFWDYSATGYRVRRQLGSVSMGRRSGDSPSGTGGEESKKEASSWRYHHLTDIQRVYCLSDLHTDHSGNMQWLQDRMLPRQGNASNTPPFDTLVTLGPTDLVVVAGDISHDLSTFAQTLQLLRTNQCRVLFVPGNHEAWSSHKPNEPPTTVLDKLNQCLDICRSLGVFVDPVYIDGPHPVWILPLESWYDGTLTFDEALCEGFEHWPWADFKRCHWGPNFPEMSAPNARIPRGLTEFFLERNQHNIVQPWRDQLQTASGSDPPPGVITVSHFAPNQQCLPDWKDLDVPTFQTNAWLDHGAGVMSAKFAKVAGSALLDAQLRTLPIRPTMHIFGHSHRPKDFVYAHIRYIHNPLGKPRERELHMVAPDVDFQCVWDATRGPVEGPTVIRYWEDYGGGKEMLWQRMSQVSPGRYQHDGSGRRVAETLPDQAVSSDQLKR